MKHEEKLELDILSKMNETGKIEMVKFSTLFPDWADYETTFTRLQGEGVFSQTFDSIYGVYSYYFELNNHGKVRLKSLLKEKSDEEEFKKWQSKQSLESSSVNNGTKILVAIGIATLFIVIATLYYTCNPYHSDPPPFIRTVKIDTTGKKINPDSFKKAFPPIVVDTVNH